MLKYLNGYSAALQAQATVLIESQQLGNYLDKKYSINAVTHGVRTDRALYDFVQTIKDQSLKSAPAIAKIQFDNTMHVVTNALGTHTAISRVQGNKLKAKREIRIASVFKEAPEPFLKMIVAHELAHLKIREHDKAFYQLCCYIEPNYHQYEFDLRLWLTHLHTK